MKIEGGVFEKIDIEDESQLYNPLFEKIRRKNAVYYDMEQYLSIKHAFRRRKPALAIPIPIQVSTLPLINVALTPFQVYKFKLFAYQTAIAEKQRSNSFKDVNFKIQTASVYANSQRTITNLQIEQFKRRLIGSYSSYYYNKFELDKVKDFNAKCKQRSINDKMNMTQKKAIYIKSLKLPGKSTSLLSLSMKRKALDKNALQHNVRIQNTPLKGINVC